MFSASLWQLVLVASSFLVAQAATTPTRASRYAEKRNNNGPPSNFVTTQNGQFMVNGSAIKFIGTNAYWLPVLNSNEDIDNVFGNMSSLGINLVRLWGFNDVETIPQNGTWFQLIQNNTLTVNTGPNGLQKLDAVVKSAENHGIYLIISLTNNWNPTVTSNGPSLSARNNNPPPTRPRNFLSNDYGGMDVYVRQFVGGKDPEHDEFYVNQAIIDGFKNYTTQVVSRFVNSPAIMGWELANDPRCNSSIPASGSCNTNTVTLWHSDLAQHVKSVDPNHLVTSGNQGFFCPDCPKLFQRIIPPPPPPQTSPAPGQRRRSVPALTRTSLLRERIEMQKKRKRNIGATDGIRVRGRWMASHTTRQEDVGVGPAFDGSQGVDSEDILSIPEIGFGTFQLFPDQNTYGPDDPSLSSFDNTVQVGTNWIQRQAEAGQRTGKPVSLTGFGLVTQDNAPDFVPFDSTVAPFQNDPPSSSSSNGVSDDQRDQAYTQWLSTGISGGLSAMLQYQWSQQGLTTEAGTTVSPVQNESGVVPISDQSGVSPNDGYGIQGVGQDQVQGVLSSAIQSLGRSAS